MRLAPLKFKILAYCDGFFAEGINLQTARDNLGAQGVSSSALAHGVTYMIVPPSTKVDKLSVSHQSDATFTMTELGTL